MDWIPVINWIWDIYTTAQGAPPPEWWEWPVKIMGSVVAARLMLPVLDHFLDVFDTIAKSTPWTWDDNLADRGKKLLSTSAMFFTKAIELILAIGSLDPKIHKRLIRIAGGK